MKFKDFKRILMSEYKNKAIKDRIQRLHSQDSFIKMVETGVVNFGSEEFRIKKNIIGGKFCYMWLESKTLSFWSVTSAIPFFAIIPSEKAILIWRKELEEPLESCLRVIDANKGANRLNQQSLMIYLSYSRPGHFYEHMNYYYSLFGNNRIKPDIAITTGDTFFDFSTLEDAEGINVLKFKDINALNRYCLESKRGVVKIKRTNIRVCFDECDHWIKKYNVFSCQLYHTIPKDAFVLWINICGEKRIWREKEETIIKLILEFKNMKDNLCVILDGMTRSSYTTREEFLADSRSAKADDEFAEKIKSLFKEVQIINSVGFSSGEKMYLADRVSFFITGFWTDSLWVAKFARAYGVAFGSKEGFRQCLICFQPNTIIMPSEYVVDIGHKGQNLSTVGYSINPDCFIGFVKNALSSFENIEKREIIFDGKGFVSNHNSQKRFYALKSLKQHKSSYLSVAENFAPFSVNTSKSYKIESGMEYNFAVNGFSKNGSFVLIVGYDEYHKRVFVDKMNFLETKKCFFPKEVKSFRLFIKLMPQDEIKFYNICWVTRNESSNPWFSIRAPLQSANSSIDTLEEENAKLRILLSDSQINQKLLIQESVIKARRISELDNAKVRIHNHLAYKLGRALILNSKSLWGYIRMPYVLSCIKESHREEQRKYQEKVAKNPSLKLPKLESYPDYKEAIKEKQCLTYRLGEALMQADKDWFKGGYLRFYFKEVPQIKRGLKERK